jgi:hypothetical protein
MAAEGAQISTRADGSVGERARARQFALCPRKKRWRNHSHSTQAPGLVLSHRAKTETATATGSQTVRTGPKRHTRGSSRRLTFHLAEAIYRLRLSIAGSLHLSIEFQRPHAHAPVPAAVAGLQTPPLPDTRMLASRRVTSKRPPPARTRLAPLLGDRAFSREISQSRVRDARPRLGLG